MKGFIAFSAISLCLIVSASAQTLNIPVLSLEAPDFLTRFNVIQSEMNKMDETNVPAFQRLMRYLNMIGAQIHNQLNNINRDITNQILGNKNITPTQCVQLITQLFAAYQKASDAIDKELADQIKAANDNFAKLKIKDTVTALNTTITTAITNQKTVAKDLVAIPGKLRDNFNTHFKGVSDAIVAIQTILNTKP